MALGTVWASGTFADTGVWAEGAWADVAEAAEVVATGKYAPQHASAIATLTRKGAALTFTQTTQGAHDPATGTFATPSTSTVTGSAVKMTGRPLKYQALGLVSGQALTLFFTPTTYGSLPALGASVTFGGITYTVRDVEALAPDGFAIAAEVVVAR